MGRKKKYNTEEERKAARRESLRKYRQNNKEKIAAYQVEYMAEYNTKYYQQNRDKILAQVAEYRQEHRDEIRAREAEYRKNNGDKIREQRVKYYSTQYGRAKCLLNAYRREDKAKNRGVCTLTSDWIVENVFSGQSCHYCGESDWTKLGVDRIDNSLPHTPENCVPCCWECNNKRKNTEYNEFMKLIGKIN